MNPNDDQSLRKNLERLGLSLSGRQIVGFVIAVIASQILALSLRYVLVGTSMAVEPVLRRSGLMTIETFNTTLATLGSFGTAFMIAAIAFDRED